MCVCMYVLMSQVSVFICMFATDYLGKQQQQKRRQNLRLPFPQQLLTACGSLSRGGSL